jgi:glycosyltransferase involved in cell wall biosynthesis
VAQPRIAAHLILGSREEPFLEPLLQSLSGAVDTLIVDDNGPGDSPHAQPLARSAFARSNRLIMQRSAFGDFAAARNRCLRLHALHDAGDWIAFVDADEVHGDLIRRIAPRLNRLPSNIDFVDGYTWHFFQSFNYYTAIERRMAFFRYAPGLRWQGTVHERLCGLRGARLALPYVYPHYGHTLCVRRHAEKGRQYSGLGAPGAVLSNDQLEGIDPLWYFRTEYPRLLRFRGKHPLVVRPVLAHLQELYAENYALTHRMAKGQSFWRKAINELRRLNYEQRWRCRSFARLARALTAPD